MIGQGDVYAHESWEVLALAGTRCSIGIDCPYELRENGNNN